MKTIILTIAVLALTGFQVPSYAMTRDQVVLSVIGEAEDQGAIGMLAVACAIRNRGSLNGVYGLKSKRVLRHKYSPETYLVAKDAVYVAWHSLDLGADSCYFIEGAQYWEGTKFPIPYWAKTMTHTATIGNQRFFRKD